MQAKFERVIPLPDGLYFCSPLPGEKYNKGAGFVVQPHGCRELFAVLSDCKIIIGFCDYQERVAKMLVDLDI